jgi:hypothetical protein
MGLPPVPLIKFGDFILKYILNKRGAVFCWGFSFKYNEIIVPGEIFQVIDMTSFL